MHDFLLFDDLPSTDPSWAKWSEMVYEEGWYNKDRSVRELMPTLPTTRTVTAKDKEGNTVCHLMWSEYDGLSYVQTFITDKEYRGKGIGKKVWERAMARIDGENTTMMLKSVVELVDFYKSWGFVVDGKKNYVYDGPAGIMLETFQKLSDGNEKSVQLITPELFPKWIEFDREVTGRDRKRYLERYFALDYTYTYCILDENDNISGTISVVPTSHTKKLNLYKVSTLYTSSTRDAAALFVRAALKIQELNPAANIGVSLLGGARGHNEFNQILTENKEIYKFCACISLTSREYSNPVDKKRLFISSNSDCHYDA